MKNVFGFFMAAAGLIFVGNITCYASDEDGSLINTINYGTNITAELYDTDKDGAADYLKLVGFGEMKNMDLEEYYDPEDDMEYVRGPLYEYDDTIRRIDIDERITSIGNYAFYGCDLVEEIKLPDVVNKIGKHSFDSCSNLLDIKIPYGVLSIGEGAFEYCENLSDIIIPSSVVTIERYAFSNCDAFTSIIIPSSVVTMGESMFNSCSNLVNVSFSDGIDSIPNRTFSWCESLNSVTIPASVDYIGEDVFLTQNNNAKNIYFVGDVDKYNEISIYDESIEGFDISFVTNEWSSNYSKCSIKITSVYEEDEYTETFSAKILPIVMKEVSCSSEGISYNLATHGGYMFTSPEIRLPAIAHDWNEGKVEIAATCSKEGLFVKICRNCGKTENTVLEKTNHNYIWKIDKEAVVGAAGSKHEECSVCGYKNVSVEIPALKPDNSDQPTKLNIKNKKAYKTSTKVTIKDSDGIKTVKLNNKKIIVKKGRKSFTFRISKYKKYLEKKAKWNTLVVIDLNGKKKTIKFKVK